MKDPQSIFDGPRFWVRNREEGPRRAGVNVTGLGGNCHHVILEAIEESDWPGTVREVERAQPLGSHRLAIFALEADDRGGLLARIGELSRMAGDDPQSPIERLARRWWNHRGTDHRLGVGMAVIAADADRLRRGLESVGQAISTGNPIDPQAIDEEGLRIIPPRLDSGDASRVAFVYPGLGNVFAGMGRELSVLWPSVMRRLDRQSRRLRDQLSPELWWTDRLPSEFADHRAAILGQVAVGSLITEVFNLLGVVPQAALGYSMGESTALVALHAWTDRDEMTRRLISSPLFATELAGPCDAARLVWGLGPDEPVDWTAGVVPCSSAVIEAAIPARSPVYVLIRNSADETVIGGRRDAVLGVVRSLNCAFFELPMVSTVHCPIGQAVERDYLALHDLPTNSPPDLKFYSGVWGRAYRPDRALAAQAITAQAAGIIDFPRVVEQAYADGIRVFLEIGPGSSCTRLIDRILADRPHLACAASRPDRGSLDTMLEALGGLIAWRVPLDLAPLYGQETQAIGHAQPDHDRPQQPNRTVVIEVGMKPRHRPRITAPARKTRPEETVTTPRNDTTDVPMAPRAEPSFLVTTMPHPEAAASALSPLTQQLLQTEVAKADAHQAFLKVARDYAEIVGKNVEFQLGLIEAMGSGMPARDATQAWPGKSRIRESHRPCPIGNRNGRSLDHHNCREPRSHSIVTSVWNSPSARSARCWARIMPRSTVIPPGFVFQTSR